MTFLDRIPLASCGNGSGDRLSMVCRKGGGAVCQLWLEGAPPPASAQRFLLTPLCTTWCTPHGAVEWRTPGHGASARQPGVDGADRSCRLPPGACIVFSSFTVLYSHALTGASCILLHAVMPSSQRCPTTCCRMPLL